MHKYPSSLAFAINDSEIQLHSRCGSSAHRVQLAVSAMDQTEKAYQKQDNVFVGAKKYLSKNRKLDRCPERVSGCR